MIATPAKALTHLPPDCDPGVGTLARNAQGCPGKKRRLRNWSQTQPTLVMAVLDTAIYAFRQRTGLRGWPDQVRP
jgi:hypothetical protein